MIVYAKMEEKGAPAEMIRNAAALADGVRAGAGHETALELLIEAGRLECGVVDGLFPDKDGACGLSARLRSCSIEAGRAFMASWEGRPTEAAKAAGRLQEKLAGLSGLPAEVVTRVPEGFAFYGLFPEVYLAAAEKFYAELAPAEAVCIGLRTIGAPLSAIAAAKLASLGVRVSSFTLRPRGHPFRRRISFDRGIEALVRSRPDAFFIIIDEGPGLSGTSFSSVARMLKGLGVNDGRVILLPSWLPDGASFISAEARDVWKRHRKYAASFEDLWVASGRLSRESGLDAHLSDLSAGMWRGLFGRDHGESYAVHPRHEKRKYLLGAPGEGGAHILKFAGHGRWGRLKLRRAEALAGAGFCPPPAGLKNGFIRYPFAEGRPVAEREVNQLLLDCAARYMAFLRRGFRAASRMEFETFLSMATRNITLALGADWGAKAGRLEGFRRVYGESVPVEIDGRMLPMEWIITRKGYLKTDCLDHHMDQFFPGCQDIAWDLAGAIIEFGLNPMEENYLLARYAAASGDEVGRDRLRLNKIGYLAFRVGYCSFASEELAATSEGEGFSVLLHRYAKALRRELIWLED